ncbi:MAG: histidine kinase dimerization/phospho-acceptor domain-containing protein [Candidatus Promineifilaceae bacterium]
MSTNLCVLIITPPHNQTISFAHQLETNFAFVLQCSQTDAQQCLSKFRPDIILIHDVPNELDGCEMAQQLKAHSYSQHIPLVMYSESADLERYADVFAVGVDDFVRANCCGANELSVRMLARINTKQLTNRLQERQTTQIDLIRNVVHDVRSPLTILSLNAHLLRSRATDNKLDRYVDTIRDQVAYLTYAIDNMVDSIVAESPV